MKDLNIVIAGFGGQGILFAGKVIAYAGLLDNLEVSWLPSYGPEMRGGTANCSVCLSERTIGSPLVTSPDVLIALNLPSLEKFEDFVTKGGIIIADSSIIDKKVSRSDIETYYIPATSLAEENGLRGLANMVMTGKLYKHIKFVSENALDAGLAKCVPAKKQEMLEFNRKALRLGNDW